MESIIQHNRERCYVCGGYATSVDPLDEHHVFFGPYRAKSEKYGLKVYLHHSKCHIFGKNSIHGNAAVCRAVQEVAQRKAMEHYGWDTEKFIKIFGRNYL